MVSYTEVSVEVINCLTFLILSQYRLYEIAAVCLVGCPFKQRAFGWCWWCVEGDTGWTDLICDNRSQKPCLMNCSYLAKSLICDYINCILAGCMWRMVKKYEIRLYQMRNTGSWPLAHIILATCVKNGRDVGSESLSLFGALWFHAAWNTWSWYSRSFVSHFLMWFCSNGTQKKSQLWRVSGTNHSLIRSVLLWSSTTHDQICWSFQMFATFFKHPFWHHRTTFPLNGRWLCSGHHPWCRRTLEHAELDTYHYSDETLSLSWS